MTTACSDYPPSPMDEPNQADEWEISKENVAPLKQGRSVPSLNQALHMGTPQRNEQLEQMKQLVFYVMESRAGNKRTPSAITSAATRFVPGNRSSTDSPLILQIYQVDAAKLSHRFASVFVGHRAVSPEVRGQSALPPGHALPSHLDHLHQFPGFQNAKDTFSFTQSRGIGTKHALFYLAETIVYEQNCDYEHTERIYQEGITQ